MSTGCSFESLAFRWLHFISSTCNNANFDPNKYNMLLPVILRETVGSPTDAALLRFCQDVGDGKVLVENLRARNEKVYQQVETNFCLSIHLQDNDPAKPLLLLCMGDSRSVWNRCDRILIKENIVDKHADQDSHVNNYRLACDEMRTLQEIVTASAMLELDPDL